MGQRRFPGLKTEMEPKLLGPRYALSRRLTELAAGQITDGLREIHTVEEVEDVGSNFQGVPLSEAHDLGEFRIDVRQPGANVSIPAQVALASECRCWEGGGGSEALDEIAPAARRDGPSGRRIRDIVSVPVRVEVAAST